MSSSSSVVDNNPRLCDVPKFADALWKYIGCVPLTSEHVLQSRIKNAIDHIVYGCDDFDDPTICGFLIPSSQHHAYDEERLKYVREVLTRAFDVPDSIANECILPSKSMITVVNGSLRTFLFAAHRYLDDKKSPIEELRPSKVVAPEKSANENNPRICDDSKFADALWKYLGCAPMVQPHVLQMTIKETIEHFAGECLDEDRCMFSIPNMVYVTDEHNLEYVRTRLARAFDVPKSVADEQILADERFASRRNSLGSFVDASARYRAHAERMNRAEEQMSKAVGPEYVSGCDERLCDCPAFTDILWRYLRCEPPTQDHLLNMNIKTAIDHLVFGCSHASDWCSMSVAMGNVQNLDDNELTYFRCMLAKAFHVPSAVVDAHVKFSGDLDTSLKNLQSLLCVANRHSREQRRNELFKLFDSKAPVLPTPPEKTTIPIAPPVSDAKIPIRVWPSGDNVKLESFDEMMCNADSEEDDSSMLSLVADFARLFKNKGIEDFAKQGYNIIDKLKKEAEMNAAEAPVTLNNFVRQISDALRVLPTPPREAKFTVTLKM